MSFAGADQIRGQSRRIQTELEEVGQFAARLEAEKGALAERLEEEGAERVTVVASISHERDFLLRQASGRGQRVLTPRSYL